VRRNEKLKLSPLDVQQTWPPATLVARKRLQAGHASVDGLFESLWAVRQHEIDTTGKVKGAFKKQSDLLRAAIVMAGATVDAVLKALVAEGLPALLDAGHNPSDRKMRSWAKRLVSSPNAGAAIINAYVGQLGNGSLQSTEDVRRVRDALGIKPEGVFSDDAIDFLKPFFRARNQVVHELDWKTPTGKRAPERRHRGPTQVRNDCQLAIEIAEDFVLATEDLLPTVLLAPAKRRRVSRSSRERRSLGES